MQSPSKISDAPASTASPAVCGLHGWADLPEGLLQSIIPLLGSFLELFRLRWHLPLLARCLFLTPIQIHILHLASTSPHPAAH
ncbi:unnamed protein product [Urochloa humidicola]